MNKKLGVALAAMALSCGTAVVALGPGVGAATFDPCAAASKGKLRYSTGKAKHLVFAVSSGYASTYVTVTSCTKKGKTWKRATTAAGRAGYKGFAKAADKREGDGKTPVGSYALRNSFGRGNPGTKLSYLKLRTKGDCWGSTIGNAKYNRYYSGTCLPKDEDLSATMKKGPYRQAVVIDYNRPTVVQGRGSAIFFHVGGKTTTAGCIAISEAKLTTIMRTLAREDRMIMGPRSALFKA